MACALEIDNLESLGLIIFRERLQMRQLLFALSAVILILQPLDAAQVPQAAKGCHILTVDFRAPNAGELFARSLKETGFAIVKNHPIDPQLVQSVYMRWAAFFNSKEKFDHTFRKDTQAGYFPFRTENAKGSNYKDLKEFYHYYTWYKNPKLVKADTDQLCGELEAMGKHLLGWLQAYAPREVKDGLSMPLPQMLVGSRDNLMRPIHYPPIAGDAEVGAVRAAAHEDIVLLTLMPAATSPGLEVKDKQGKWHKVECDSGTIVVNGGDMLQLATNGFYPSTTHRVVNPIGVAAKKPRISIPFFIHPAASVQLSKEHTQASFLRQRLVELGLIKAEDQHNEIKRSVS